MRVLPVLFAAMLLAFSPLNAAIAAGVSQSRIVSILTDQGYNAQEFQADKVIVDASGYRIIVWIDGADGDISYITYLPGITADEVGYKILNKFNNDVKFGRAFADGDGDIRLQMDRNSSGGVSAENIESDFDVFLMLIGKFLSDLESQTIA
jgi:Putative bacterial sensory transduction regulator